MTTLEILKRVAENHNRIARIIVSGDNAVLVGDTIKDLRSLAQQLQIDYEAEQQANTEQEIRQEEIPEVAEQKE